MNCQKSFFPMFYRKNKKNRQNTIEKKAFTHQEDSHDDAPKIDSIKISDQEIYAFIPGDSQTSVNKWGMNYYALAKISEDGKVIEKLIESDDLKKDGINGRFTDSQYVIWKK